MLFIFTVAKDGGVFELNTGGIVPLKLIIPVEEEVIAFINCKVCIRVPVNVEEPLLVKDPLFVRSPSSEALLFPKLKVPLTSMKRSPAIETAPVVTVYDPFIIYKLYKVRAPVKVFEIPFKMSVLPAGINVPLLV